MRVSTRLIYVFSIILFAFTLSVQAADDLGQFWLSPQATQVQGFEQKGRFEVLTQYTDKLADRSMEVLDSDQIISTFVSTVTSLGSVSVASNYSDKEYSSSLGAKIGAINVYANSGRGESYSHNLSDYNGLDPYAFHGGNLSSYRYFGTSLAYDFEGGNTLQFGQTTVEADRLEDRRSSYVDFSNETFFARYTHIDRGGDSVAFGLDAGVKVGGFNVGYQQLSSRYDISTKRIRLNWAHDSKNRFWLDFSKHRNAALSSYNDSTVMFSWQHSFGAKRVAHYAVEGQPQEQKKKLKTPRGILIGGAVAAAAILASSGSDSQDSAVRVSPSTPGASLVRNVQAQHDAAKMRLNQINPVSVSQNREFGGYVFQLPDGSYAATVAIRGEAASVNLPDPRSAVPAGTFARASYHTHAAADPRFDNENFSPTDLESDRSTNLDGYLATPGGAFKFFEVSTGNISTLGRINNGG